LLGLTATPSCEEPDTELLSVELLSSSGGLRGAWSGREVVRPGKGGLEGD